MSVRGTHCYAFSEIYEDLQFSNPIVYVSGSEALFFDSMDSATCTFCRPLIALSFRFCTRMNESNLTDLTVSQFSLNCSKKYVSVSAFVIISENSFESLK
jgi:hypothetical protein